MPDDLESIFAEVEAADAGVGQVDEPVVDSTDVTDGEPDIDVDVDVDAADEVDDNPEIEGIDDQAETVDQWDWSEYSDRMVPVKIDGEEQLVKLSDLRDGFMMRADYTRKTQALADSERAAQWAAEVQDAFERDPQGTLEAFARAYGLLGDPQQDRQPSLDEIDEDIRPWAEKATQAEQQLHQMEQRMMQLEQERLKSEIKSELDMLANRFGDSFDKVEVLQLAAQKNLPLEDAYYRLMGERQFKQTQSQSQAEREAAEAAEREKVKAEEARQAAKAKAANTSKGSFKASDIPADDFNDIGELFEQLLAGS